MVKNKGKIEEKNGVVKRIIALFTVVFMMFCVVACGNTNDKDEENTTVEKATVGEDKENATGEEETKEYTLDIGSDWKYAYSGQGYDYYYMKLSEDVHDSNTVLTVYEEKSFAGKDLDLVKESTEKMYGDTATVEIKKIGNKEVICAKIKYSEEENVAYVTQYVVVGKKTAVVVSVYASEEKYDLACENASEVIGTMTVN